MNKKNLLIKTLALLAVCGIAALFFAPKDRAGDTCGECPLQPPAPESRPAAEKPRPKPAEAQKAVEGEKKTVVITSEETLQEDPETAAAREQQEKEHDALIAAVREWETLTDEVVSKESQVPIKDRAKRVKEGLKNVPESERAVALQSMLNLVEDEEFAILDDILFDLAEPKETVEAIFDDMLNRPEALKLGYLVKIAQMRDHPMFADAMHILTVTTPEPETPTEEESN